MDNTSLVLSLAACTLGWSKGLISSTQPTTAVASSKSTMMRPRSAAPWVSIVMTGCSASVRRPTTASLSAAPARGVMQVQEDAVAAVGLRRAERLVGHRQHALAVLARRLGDQLLDPQPVGLDRRVDDEGQLVAARERQLADRAAEPEAGVGGRVGITQRRTELRRAAQQRAQVGAQQRGRHEAEVRQRAVAPADVGVVEEDAPEAALLAQGREPRARIGDGDELRAVAAGLLPEVVEGRQRLDRPAGLRGDDEERLGDVDLGLDVAHGVGVGRVQHVQDQPVGVRAERAPEDLRRQRRAAHAEHDRLGQAVGVGLLGERLQVVDLGSAGGRGRPASRGGCRLRAGPRGPRACRRARRSGARPPRHVRAPGARRSPAHTGSGSTRRSPRAATI